VWIDRLYAPAHGLSIDRTEGIAMLIRYLATTGQEKAAAVGEGRLPSSLVAKALQAADELVVSNCQGADREIVVNADVSPLVPATAKAMRAIGSMAHCVPVAPSTTTTATSTTTAATVAPTTAPAPPSEVSQQGTPSYVTSGTDGYTASATTAAIPPSGTTPPTGAASTQTPGGGPATDGAASKKVTGLLTASKLPLPTPSKAPGGDRLATFALGALLYLLGRKPVARLARKVMA